MREPGDHEKRCSFCRKNVASVRYLITAPASSICDECVVLSMQILVENRSVPRTTILGLLFA